MSLGVKLAIREIVFWDITARVLPAIQKLYSNSYNEEEQV